MLVRLLGHGLCVALGALALAGAATAHLPYQPQAEGLRATERAQARNLAHARYVCAHGARAHKRWACRAQGWLGRELGQTRALVAARRTAGMSPREAICHVFGPACSAALAVAHCETGGTYSVYAQNGQYLGLFQMGEYARARYGHSYTAYGQARAAHAYYSDAGGWGPWACKP